MMMVHMNLLKRYERQITVAAITGTDTERMPEETEVKGEEDFQFQMADAHPSTEWERGEADTRVRSKKRSFLKYCRGSQRP